MRSLPSPFAAASAAYLEALQARHLADPLAVDSGWACVFDALRQLDVEGAVAQAAATALLTGAAFRERGHLAADLDPLGLAERDSRVEPDLASLARLGARLAEGARGDAAQTAAWFREVYCGPLAAETAHIDAADIRAFIHAAMEATPTPLAPEDRLRALDLLLAGQEFERFLAVKFPGKRRFGAEGADSLVPLLDRILSEAAARGITEVLVGGMHRGRLSLMHNVLGKPALELLAEFAGAKPFDTPLPIAADMPYHLGFATELAFGNRRLRLTLAPNPSHLEAVNPVLIGRVRARQDIAMQGGAEPKHVLGLILHTDASVIAQGVVAEMLQLSGLAGFATAGTIHVVVNNQIGFTTEPQEARSSRHCTGAWKAIDSLILHVNGDDVDAVLRAADLACAFRQAQGRDAVIDLVCYRRNGHNEIDEPRFTQPLSYRRIDERQDVGTRYAAQLETEGLTTPGEVARLAAGHRQSLQEAFAGTAAYRAARGTARDAAADAREPETGVPPERLRMLLARLSALPAGMALDPKVARLVGRRAAQAEQGVAWATAEALAFASLLTQGVGVRLSGQDVIRGAFSHRHLALTDRETGSRHVSLNHLEAGQAMFDAVNSPLSEYAVLGFEYGYSLERPDALVLWEAQFGDFANGAQIILDQFIASGQEKWQLPSGLVVLLPHGLEGQGPEHSSARPERLLQLAARGNLRIAHPSTPANYFHLLRGQMRRPARKPLFVLSPKTLLRLPAAVSDLAAFGPGTAFQPILVGAAPAGVRRVLLCGGKIAYELERGQADRGLADLAIIRIERLYPFPECELEDVARRWTQARFAYVQEEPRNQGAWSFIAPRLEALLARCGVHEPRPCCFSRPESSSPAGSFHAEHAADQARLVEEALGWAVDADPKARGAEPRA